MKVKVITILENNYVFSSYVDTTERNIRIPAISKKGVQSEILIPIRTYDNLNATYFIALANPNTPDEEIVKAIRQNA